MRAAGCSGFLYFLVCLLFWAANIEIFEKTGNKLEGGEGSSSHLRNNGISSKCDDTTTGEEEENEIERKFRHLLTDYETLLDHIRQQRLRMEEDFRDDYSHYYDSLFYDTPHSNTSRGKQALYSPRQPQGWNALKDRLKIKLLQVQQNLLKSNKCNNDEHEPTPPTKWIHAVAGHSSAAGHGNFVEDSYGAVMDRALQPLFQSLGIQLETRVYGMSGKPSAPEMALCQEAILGIDTDLIMWDYAQTDSGEYWNFQYWMQRATLLQSHPVLMANQLTNYAYKTHKVVSNLHQQHPHLPLMVINQTVVNEMESAVPDSLQEFNLPPLLANLKCGEDTDILEVNEPCKEQKFNQSDMCPDRYWQAPWHPGYRRLALFGKLLALGYVDALEEAVQELIVQKEEEVMTTTVQSKSRQTKTTTTTTTTTTTDADNDADSSISGMSLVTIQTKLQQLQETNQQQIQRMLSTTYHPKLGREESPEEDLSTQFPGLNTSWLYEQPSLCRTMRLPSQQRYKGINTGGKPVQYNGLIPTEGLEHEDNIAQAYDNPNTTTTNSVDMSPDDALEMELGYDNKARASQLTCPNRTTNHDYSDYFYVTDTWRKTTVPSQNEMEEYYFGSSDHTFHGLIIICPLQCDRQSRVCYKDEILTPRKHWDRLDIQVNGIGGAKMVQFINKECGILRHAETGRFVFPPDDHGMYDLRIRINPEKVEASEEDGGITKLLQIASIVLI